MHILATFLAGLLFGLGLCISGLIDPSKVQAFLDVTGRWDPSLAFTMAAAIAVTALGYRLAFARGTPIFARAFQIPPPATVDLRLVAGAVIFGIGWGLVGFCPGPAIAALALGNVHPFLFVAAMLAGMAAARQLTMAVPTAALPPPGPPNSYNRRFP